MDVEVKLNSSQQKFVFANAAPDADGDYSTVNAMNMGMANTAKLMVEFGKDLDGFAAEVEWTAQGLESIEALAKKIPSWGQPSVEDMLLVYESGLGKTTPNSIEMLFKVAPSTVAPPEGGGDNGGGIVIGPGDVLNPNVPTDAIGKTVVLLEDIERVPQNYPNSETPLKANTVYARTDGSYFYSDGVEERAIDLEDSSYRTKATLQPDGTVQGPPLASLISTWIDALGACKESLSALSQTQMSYLQSTTEVYDRAVALLDALLTALKRLLEALLR